MRSREAGVFDPATVRSLSTPGLAACARERRAFFDPAPVRSLVNPGLGGVRSREAASSTRRSGARCQLYTAAAPLPFGEPAVGNSVEPFPATASQ